MIARSRGESREREGVDLKVASSGPGGDDLAERMNVEVGEFGVEGCSLQSGFGELSRGACVGRRACRRTMEAFCL